MLLGDKRLCGRLLEIESKFPPEHIISYRLSKRGKHFHAFISKITQDSDGNETMYLVWEKWGIRI